MKDTNFIIVLHMRVWQQLRMREKKDATRSQNNNRLLTTANEYSRKIYIMRTLTETNRRKEKNRKETLYIYLFIRNFHLRSFIACSQQLRPLTDILIGCSFHFVFYFISFYLIFYIGVFFICMAHTHIHVWNTRFHRWSTVMYAFRVNDVCSFFLVVVENSCCLCVYSVRCTRTRRTNWSQ